MPDGDEYAAGDTAELLVQAPFAPAWGTVTIAHHDIVSVESFEAEDGSAVLEIPITGEYVPNLTVQIDMTGSAPRTDDDGVPRDDLPTRPAYATGTIDLPVPPTERTLSVDVTPADDAVEPGADTSVTVTVTDADGAPVEASEVAVVIVDEAVLSLTGYELDDPIDVFYRNVWSTLRSRYLRSSIRLASTVQLDGENPATSVVEEGEASAEEPADEMASDDGALGDFDSAGGDGAARSSQTAIDVRTDFDAVAVYAPSEVTGIDGTVTVDVPLPDNLTRYRVMAVAVDGVDQFGSGESSIAARLPLMARTSPPRFLNFGDQFELPVVVQNQTDEPLEVDVVVETANLSLSGPSGKRVTVPANDRVEVRFPAETVEAGTARARVVAVSGTYSGERDQHAGVPRRPRAGVKVVRHDRRGKSDRTAAAAARERDPPVRWPRDRHLVDRGQLADRRRPVPPGVRVPVVRRLRPRIMAVAALRDVLEAFDAAGHRPAARTRPACRGRHHRLTALQNADGGFPYWRGRRSIP
ncbi:MAG: DUF6049 family protein [Ilumatobacteraceae bacterium]